MPKSNNKIFFLTSFLLLASAVLIKYISLNSIYIGGHDTFQYIHWADILFTEDRDLIFFRPVLYLIIFISHSLLSWSAAAFKLTLITFWFASIISLILLLYRLKVSYFISSAVLLSFAFSSVWIEGDAVGHITSIETFFIILLLQFGLNLQQKKNSLNYLCYLIASILLILIHEEKIIYALALLFVIENNFVRSVKFSSILLILLIFIYFLLGGQTLDENSIFIAGSVALGWGSHLYILDNFWNTYSSSSNQFGFFESTLLTGIMVYVVISWIQKFYKTYFVLKENTANNDGLFLVNLNRLHNIFMLNNVMTKNTRFLILPGIIYFLITGIIFAGIDLPRTTTPVILPVLIGSFIFLCSKDFSFFIRASFLSLIFLGGLINFFNSRGFIAMHDELEERYIQAYTLLDEIDYACEDSGKVALDTSFENRAPMWGDSDNKYGLSSKVYMGSCAEKIILDKDISINKYGAIVFFKDDLVQVQKYDDFEMNPIWKKLNIENTIIFIRR